MKQNFLIYGVNGYTGRLILDEALRRGLKPILAGRHATAVESLAHKHGLEARIFDLSDVESVMASLKDISVVLHSAGPFIHTYKPVLEACLKTGTHYLDITGEMKVFEAIHARDAELKSANVLAVPAVGFDVVPTDCFAAILKESLPTATHLTMCIATNGKASRGTIKTAIENLGAGGVIRENGILKSVPSDYKFRDFDFSFGKRRAVTVPWGDVYTAFVTTGIPNIEEFMALPPLTLKLLPHFEKVRTFLDHKFIKDVLMSAVDVLTYGPNAGARKKSHVEIFGEVTDGKTKKTMRLKIPEGYEFTATCAIACVEEVLKNPKQSGFKTPALAFGTNFLKQLPGVTISE